MHLYLYRWVWGCEDNINWNNNLQRDGPMVECKCYSAFDQFWVVDAKRWEPVQNASGIAYMLCIYVKPRPLYDTKQ